MFLHILVGQNPNKSIAKNYPFYDVMLEYICAKKYTSQLFKNENIL